MIKVLNFLRKRVLLVFLAFLLLGGCCVAQNVQSMPRGETTEAWLSSADRFHQDVLEGSLISPAYSLMVVENGKVVLERYYGEENAETKGHRFSIAKTVLAFAVGLAMEEGRFGLEDKVVDYFPRQHSVSETVKEMKIRHLLTMTSGLEESPKLLGAFRGERDFDWETEFFNSPQVSEPGSKFYYNFFSSYIMAAIVEKTTGERVLDYLEPRLLAPMGIEDLEWETAPDGVCVGGWGLKLSMEDMAKIGQLLLDGGKWNGKQLVDSQWIDAMVTKQVNSSNINAFIKAKKQEGKDDPNEEHAQGYGYYVWKGTHGTYRPEGMKQVILVQPEKRIVLVFSSDSFVNQELFNLIWKNFNF